MTGPLTIDAALNVNGAIASSSLSVTGNTNIGGNLTVSGNLEVKGDVIARDTEHIAGNVSLGDADNDEVKITGVLRSGHSSGTLLVDDTLYATGSLTVDGNVGIGTNNPRAKLQILNTNQNANGNSLIIGPTNQSNLRLGYHQNYSWIQSHGSKPLAINPIGNNVGIGTTNPRSKLEVSGGIRLSDVPVWDGTNDNDLTWDRSRITREGSSRRYKQNIFLLEDDFSKILSLEPKQYEMKEEYGGQGTLNFGYIAEELDELGLTKLVTYDESGQPDGIKYKKMCIYLLEVIKDLYKRVDNISSQASHEH